MPIVIHTMIENSDKKSPIWEEIFIDAPEEPVSNLTQTYSETEFKDYFGTDESIKEELHTPKNIIIENISDDFTQKGFLTEDFLSTDLSGNIRLKTGHFTDSLYPNYSKTPESENKILEAVDTILGIYQKNFVNDPQILEYVIPILLRQSRLTDVITLVNSFKKRNMLPLRIHIFFILVGVYENKLENLFLTGDETILVNILYKYKFHSISKLEKNRLYDMVLSRENPDLIGIVFHLFSDTFKGIRNIFPIYKSILKNFDRLEKSEKKIFLESYKETGNYLETYFLLKKVYKKKDLEQWLKQMKTINGKFVPGSENTFPGFEDQEDILVKYRNLKKDALTHTLSPFEILVLLNTNISLQLKNEIFDSYRKLPYSYITNRAIAVVYYYETDYRKFLLHLERAGSLRNHSECIYLKAVACMEIGFKKEAKQLLLALKTAFPNARAIKESLEKLENY
ncbi:MAG: hypothetical protein KDK36_10735 [Leptospiraceae bacterium]|nr:hypothetical protein [Leptospiraceae bacterium]